MQQEELAGEGWREEGDGTAHIQSEQSSEQSMRNPTPSDSKKINSFIFIGCSR